MPRQIEAPRLEFISPSSSVLADSQKLLVAAARAQAHIWKAGLRCQIEALSFLTRRWEQDLKLVDDLTGSEEVNDAFDIYASFVRDAVTDYSAEAGKIATIGSKIASDTARQVREETDTIVKDMAAKAVVVA